jgi:hypothetical protein
MIFEAPEDFLPEDYCDNGGLGCADNLGCGSGGMGCMGQMGQIIPGVSAATQKLVIQGSVILVAASVFLYFLMRKPAAVPVPTAAPAPAPVPTGGA